MKVGIIQHNPKVGDFWGNSKKIIKEYQKLVQKGADLVVTPELALFAYPPKDLLLREDLLDRHNKALLDLVDKIGEVPLVLGTVKRRKSKKGKKLKNAAFWIQNKKAKLFQEKTHLPTHDVFDESRYFEASDGKINIREFKGRKIAVLICEDLWGENYETNLLKRASELSVDTLLTLNASPFYINKKMERIALFSDLKKMDIVYVNQVGGNDELVFDGRSFVLGKKGIFLAEAKAFEEDSLVVDLNSQKEVTAFENKQKNLFDALTLGIKDYFYKQGFKKAVLGLSGGIDSALVAVLAKEALGAENVSALAMPSKFSSRESVEDAQKLAENLGIDFKVLSIAKMYESFGQTVVDLIGWERKGEIEITEENVQARIRGQILMAISNRSGALVLATGNKSELAVGYCTLYGDMTGGFAPIFDLYKSEVFSLAEYINKNGEIIPQSILKKEPTAELRPNQKDSQSLPPYEILDEILKAFIEKKLGPEQTIKLGFEAEVVKRVYQLLVKSEYKRQQAPVGLKLTRQAFGFGWRCPIAAEK